MSFVKSSNYWCNWIGFCALVLKPFLCKIFVFIILTLASVPEKEKKVVSAGSEEENTKKCVGLFQRGKIYIELFMLSEKKT